MKKSSRTSPATLTRPLTMPLLISLPAAVFLSLAATPAALGQGLRAPRCADGSAGDFNGHPVIPLDCPENLAERPGSGAPLAPEALFMKKPDKGLLDPSPLLGKWESIAVYANQRYEVFLQVEKGKGKSLEAVLQVRNYRSREETTAHAKAKARWTRGLYDAEARLLFWDGQGKPLKAGLRFAPVPPGSPEAARFDRFALLSYDGKRGQHLLFFKPDGPDRLVFQYEDRSGFFASEPVRSEGVLTRSKKDSL
ncbi:MAG: hypothetical protein WC943_14695 [Elusimicrobiota bacterium]|jgi:hypothetical protein